jgi:hypothetical protein
VADLTFSQSKRRNLVAPLLIAVLVLAGAAAFILHSLPNKDADLKITHVATWSSHTVFKSDSIVVGQDSTEDNLYILTTLRVDNHLQIPIFLKDFTATLTTANGQLLTASAIEQSDLPNLYQTFPDLKPLSTIPLLRETSIVPTRSADGMILLRFPITKADWDHRQSATLSVAFYHQPPQTITIPNS